MKKLPVLLLLLQLPWLSPGQTLAKNSLGLTTGPNWFFHKTDFPYSGTFSARTGYTIGLDYSRALTPQWQIVLGLRHNQWRSTYKTVLLFPSQNPDGSITLVPGQTAETHINDNAWQLHTGLRWSNNGPVWRLLGEATGGITDYSEPGGGNAPLRFQIRAGAGVEWLPVNSDFQFFVLPTVQYLFKENKSNSPARTAFLVPTLETGARLSF